MALEITWFGRTCFRMRGREGAVVCDPCPPASGYKIGKLEANVVTLSLTRTLDGILDDLAARRVSPQVRNAF